ncbi:helix-turn-helix domain-containing protein [Microbacterium dauci]|uniref:Helix-turn-helix domain-containing protein n=1 Tax=Microbacterium dauci TaxID=3048008 RepID=A0ABT6ZB77_9MICO|nr:helix-turn-helix domain-containing protein [Microbacterium sp. LX3-4]MDJ1113408.1 helix-turn-helix domain-containing protein [Microbacterium sp. LX3-4]
MVTASTLVRAARKSERLTQAELATRARLDQSAVSRSERGRDAEFGTVDRLLAGAGYRLYAAPTRRDDAATAAAEIRLRLREGDRPGALRALLQLNDNLVAERGLIRGVLTITEPEPTGEAVWDAAIAALVEWRLRDEKLPLPPWTSSLTRALSNARTLEVDPADPTPPRTAVPDAFAKRGVLVWADTFASV